MMRMIHYVLLHHHLHVPASILEAEAPQATTSFTAVVEVSRVEGEIISESGAPSHIRRHIHLNKS
jgi:hypothetical protein